MDTNMMSLLVQVLQTKQAAAPTSDFWMLLAPGILAMFGAIAAYLQSVSNRRLAESANITVAAMAAKADVAHEKAEIVAKKIDVIGVEVNSKADTAVRKSDAQEIRVESLTKDVSRLTEEANNLKVAAAKSNNLIG